MKRQSTTFVDLHEGGDQAIIVQMNLPGMDAAAELTEFKELAHSAGATILNALFTNRKQPEARFFIGKGKAEELKTLVQVHHADVVLFNHELTPAQVRNLEQLLECRVVDRTGLILDIFALRARTHEGKLQVELAQLEHLASRLVRGWTHLERQKGGIGLRGPGETQLETDRRLLQVRIKQIKKKLEKVIMQREQSRRARKRAAIPTVSLVGYTNAGKSTLFNTLTESHVYAADQLFATLDPTLRHINLPAYGDVVIADTVGFIRHLPHKLVAAFRATLEESAQADLLLHVVDASSDDAPQLIDAVNDVLKEIRADEVPCLVVFNKIDKLERKPRIDLDGHGDPVRVWLSAQTGDGIERLVEAMRERLAEQMMRQTVVLKPSQGKLRAELYAKEAVLMEQTQEDGSMELLVQLPKMDLARLLEK